MKVLTIGSDRKLFDKDSAVRTRIIEYGLLCEELHTIVFTKKGFNSEKFGNVFLYPTNSKNRWAYVCDAIRIGQKIISGKDWLISAQDPFESGLVGFWLKKCSDAKLQLQIHTDFLNEYFWRESFLNKIRVVLAKFLIKRADGLRVVSERIKKSLAGFDLKAEIFVLPIFVDTSATRPAAAKESLKQKFPQFDFIFLMVSRLTKEKNISLALESFASILSEHPGVGLIVAGEGEELGCLKKLAGRLRIENSAIFESWSDDPGFYYGGADCYLLTSNYEGYGRTVIEAASFGLPIVMTDVGCAGEVIENNESGLIIPVKSKDGLTAAMRKILRDSALREKLGAGARRAAAGLPEKEEILQRYKLSWQKAAKT